MSAIANDIFWDFQMLCNQKENHKTQNTANELQINLTEKSDNW